MSLSGQLADKSFLNEGGSVTQRPAHGLKGPLSVYNKGIPRPGTWIDDVEGPKGHQDETHPGQLPGGVGRPHLVGRPGGGSSGAALPPGGACEEYSSNVLAGVGACLKAVHDPSINHVEAHGSPLGYKRRPIPPLSTYTITKSHLLSCLEPMLLHLCLEH